MYYTCSLSPSKKAEDDERLLSLSSQMREALVCATLSLGLTIKGAVEQRISATETHYWVETVADTQEPQVTGVPDEHIRFYSTLYEHRTKIPASKAMLVERIKVESNQLSASWKFVEKFDNLTTQQECNNAS